MNVSIIVTTKNEGLNIANCLKSLKLQTYTSSQIEIIVVDNDSIDKTKEVARQYTDKVYNFGPQRSAQLNFGVRQARGRYILFLDADMVLSKDVVKECVCNCEKKNLIALYIPERVIGQGFMGKVRDFERSFYTATCVDAVRFVKKDKFIEVNGFDETLDFGPDDWDFDRRIKRMGKVGVISSILYHNEKELNLKTYLRKKDRYHKSFLKYMQKWGREDGIIKKQLGFWYRFFGIFVENGKWRLLLRHPVLTLAMYPLRIVVGLRYVKKKPRL